MAKGGDRFMNGYTGFDTALASSVEDEQKEQAAEQLWFDVVKHINDVLEAHEELGFMRFHQKANPSIAEIQLSISAIEGALNGMVKAPSLTHRAWQDLTNCLQSIHLIGRLFVSLVRKDQAEYESCIQKLKTQRI